MKISIYIILNFIFLELLLQLIFSPRINFSGNQSAKRVIVLGESTSASVANNLDWPAQLQQYIDRENINLLLINAAVPATTTNKLLSRFPSLLEEYKPIMVISMMGINDYHRIWLKDFIIHDDNWFLNLKTIRIIRFLWQKLEIRATGSFVNDNIDSSNLGFVYDDYFVKLFKNCNLNKIICTKGFLELKEKLVKYSNLERSKYYNHLALEVLPDQLDPKPFYKNQSLLYYEASKNDARVNSNTNSALHMAISSGMRHLCRDIVGFAIRDNIRLNDTFLLRVATCLQDDPKYVNEILKRAGGEYVFKPNLSPFPTKLNYQALREIVLNNNICWIAMSYPTQDFPDYFQALEKSDKNLIFKLSNKDNFLKALQQYRYDQLFTDKFGLTFGHATKLGNELIAKNVISFIKNLMQKNKCNLK